MNIKIPLAVAATALIASHTSAVQPATDEVAKSTQTEREYQGGENAMLPAATVSGGDNQISFRVNERGIGRQAAVYKETVVDISGPGEFSSRASFKPGLTPTFVGHFEDGLYEWEIVNVPEIPNNIREELMALRESGDTLKEQELTELYRKQGLLPTRAEMHTNRNSGTFRIVEGSVVDSDLVE